ncbi:unnamed protein product [Ceutorhynchus assimilis]|uniref:Cytochrome P450 n=1 Tax=Ceutorhynchus assimilis TaxID=467358 RepID=A0A9N9N0X2_9CUCU|nr:unnamed protein product [Ceutorhynchus assimilis]
MPIILYILISIFVLFFVLLFVYTRIVKSTSKYMRNLSGPKPIFPFGNTLELIGGSTVTLNVIMKYLNIHGDIILTHPGPLAWAVVSVDHDFNELLFSSSTHIEKSVQYEFMNNWLGLGLLTSKGSHWRKHRKAITPAFHFSILKDFIAVFDSNGTNLIKRLKGEVGKDSTEISKVVSLYALDVICEATMGVRVNALEQENSEYIKSVKALCSIIVDRIFSPLHPLLYPITWNYYKEKRALKVVHAYVEDVISQRIEEKSKKNLNKDRHKMEEDFGLKRRLAFLDLLLETTIDGQLLSKRDLRDEVNTFMFEGHDTTSTAISFCLLMLATHPEAQEKVIKEQIDIFGSNLKTASPTYNELNEMKYLDLVIKETLRLFPSVPFFGRKLSNDIEFKGNLYPKGLTVMIIPYAFQRNPNIFPNPEEFIPERFQDYNNKFPYAYTPFSAGPRNCIGQKFAMLEMLSTVSKVIRNFKLAPSKPEHKIKIAAETILISANGVRISLENREC